jgi:hypothetical protein
MDRRKCLRGRPRELDGQSFDEPEKSNESRTCLDRFLTGDHRREFRAAVERRTSARVGEAPAVARRASAPVGRALPREAAYRRLLAV